MCDVTADNRRGPAFSAHTVTHWLKCLNPRLVMNAFLRALCNCDSEPTEESFIVTSSPPYLFCPPTTSDGIQEVSHSSPVKATTRNGLMFSALAAT